MKQKILLSKLFIFIILSAMVLGINTSAMVDENKWYEITFPNGYNNWIEFYDYHGITGRYIFEKGYLKINGDMIDFYFTAENIGDISLKFEKVPPEENYGSTYLATEINGLDVKSLNIWHDASISDGVSGAKSISTKLLYSETGKDFFQIHLDGDLIEATDIVHTFSSPFAGIATSDSGNYALSLAGYFDMGLANGTHELTLAEIAKQTIAIVARNHITGETSVMREDMIVGITVTVSSGQVTSCLIRGKVQTDNGMMDYFTCTITP